MIRAILVSSAALLAVTSASAAEAPSRPQVPSKQVTEVSGVARTGFVHDENGYIRINAESKPASMQAAERGRHGNLLDENG